MTYQSIIAAHPAAQGIDPRHILAHMRCENRCLDGLSPGTLEHEIEIAAGVTRMNPWLAERLARSYGL